MRHRGLHSLACLLSAVMFMFCGPHFLQVHAGHLPNLCTLIWAPLLFLAMDKMADRPALGPCLLGMFAVAMSVLAGHPQFVFYMGVAAGVYAVLQAVRSRQRGKVILGFGAIALGGAALSAVQLLTGLQEGGETTRSVGMSYHFAGSYSFPPENFLTLLMPWFFGDMKSVPYWGLWYLTETSLFVSVMGLMLAVYGMVYGKPAARRFSITMLVLALVLALGRYTPLFYVLYNYVPGFNAFRGMDKFLWLAALFLSALAGIGMDQMLRGQTAPAVAGGGGGRPGSGAVPAGLVARPVGLVGARGAERPGHRREHLAVLGFWRPCLRCAQQPPCRSQPASRRPFPVRGRLSFGTGPLAPQPGLSWSASGGRHRTGLFCRDFADDISNPPRPMRPEQTDLLAQNPGDYRIVQFNPNVAMTIGALNVEGDDPSGLLRYRRFLDFAEGFDFDTAPVRHASRRDFDTNALRMLRCRYLISADERIALGGSAAPCRTCCWWTGSA